MAEVITIELDIAKHAFQTHGVDANGRQFSPGQQACSTHTGHLDEAAAFEKCNGFRHGQAPARA